MTYVFIARRCDDLPVTVCCRIMKVSTSGYCAWQTHPVSARDLDDAILTNHIYDIHVLSRRSYGSPRVHAELRLGDLALRRGRKRVERLMRQAGIAGIHGRRGHGCTVRDRMAVPSEDLVNRRFNLEAADKLWVMDVTEFPLALRSHELPMLCTPIRSLNVSECASYVHRSVPNRVNLGT